MATRVARESNRRLAQYRPFEQGGLNLQDVVGDLLLAVASESGGHVDSLAECREAFKTLWGLDVEIDELRVAIDAAVEVGVAQRIAGGFSLTEQGAAAQEARVQESRDVEREALELWESDVRKLRPELDQADFACLQEDLEEWIQRIVQRHGAEAAMLLYPEEPRARLLFEQIDELGTSLPQREGAVGTVRDEALRLFVRRPEPAQRRHLASRLNTAFYLTVLTLDPAAKQLVRAASVGRRIYLDTNVLFAVLGAASAREVASIHRLLELTVDLGCEVAITPWTLEELKETVARSKREVEAIGWRAPIAELMVRVSGEQGFGSLFWKRYSETGVSPKDFFARVSQVEMLLEAANIAVVSEGCVAAEAQTARIDEYEVLLRKVLYDLYRDDRHPAVLRHDVLHRVLIEKRRGDTGSASFTKSRIWFLTQDGMMPRFADRHLEGEAQAEMPFCISPSAWAQIVRALTPRTDDYEQTVVDLLASPYVGHRAAVDQRAVREVVGRMADQEDGSPELALAVLEDSALVRQISRAEQDALDDEVRDAYSQKARQLIEEAEESKRHLAEERQAHLAAENAAAEERERLEQKAEQERKAAEDASRDLQRLQTLKSEEQAAQTRAHQAQIAEREATIAREQIARAGLEAEAERLREQEQQRKGRNKRIALAIVYIAVAVVLAVIAAIRDRGPVPTAVLVGISVYAVTGALYVAARPTSRETTLKFLQTAISIGSAVIALGINVF